MSTLQLKTTALMLHTIQYTPLTTSPSMRYFNILFQLPQTQEKLTVMTINVHAHIIFL